MALNTQRLAVYLRLGQLSEEAVRSLDLIVDLTNNLLVETAPAALPAVADKISLEVAARAWRNPEGAKRRQSTTGPFGKSVELAETRSGVYLTDAETTELLNLPTAAAAAAPWSGSMPYRR